MPSEDEVRSPRGIQSVEVGGRLLLALAHVGRPLALKDLAQEADMAPGKAHPYLVSFGKLGLIEQDAAGRYGLGPLALQLGLISLQQYDPVRLATPALIELAQDTGHTASMALWGNRGPTIVRIEEAPSAVHVHMRPGTVASVRNTATGKVFAAFVGRELLLRALADEAGRDPSRPALRIEAKFAAELAEIRARGLSLAIDSTLPGISAMAAPVFDISGRIVMGLTVIGPSMVFDSAPDAALARTLRSTAQALSRRLGSPLPQPGV
ncbi:MAG: IclR family transcriptional regulator [Thiomonas sp.]